MSQSRRRARRRHSSAAAGPTAAFECRGVLAGVEKAARVRMFERAGYGWSEDGPALARTRLLKVLVLAGASPFSTKLGGLAGDERRMAIAQACDPRVYATLLAEPSSVRQSLDEAQRLRRHLGDLPLAVVTRGRGRGTSEAEAAWQRLQQELATRSTRSTHVIATKRGHYAHEDEPDLVVRAILSVAGA